MNMSNAGAGALSVTTDGPSKVKMDCQKCPEGYRVTITPMAPGSYLISIKYGALPHWEQPLQSQSHSQSQVPWARC
uniref:filamin-A-like n=1 Tax=Callithrix jacchus TaxID=9483 RepID=UPI0023DCF7AB|nr:filamin-A-like [Callithrix jacchus]